MHPPRSIIVEFFGIPRQRAGCTDAVVAGNTLGEVLANIESAYPTLRGLRHADGGPAPQYLVSLDGQRFLSDPQHRLEPGARLLLLSADAGG